MKTRTYLPVLFFLVACFLVGCDDDNQGLIEAAPKITSGLTYDQALEKQSKELQIRYKKTNIDSFLNLMGRAAGFLAQSGFDSERDSLRMKAKYTLELSIKENTEMGGKANFLSILTTGGSTKKEESVRLVFEQELLPDSLGRKGNTIQMNTQETVIIGDLMKLLSGPWKSRFKGGKEYHITENPLNSKLTYEAYFQVVTDDELGIKIEVVDFFSASVLAKKTLAKAHKMTIVLEPMVLKGRKGTEE